LQHVAGLQTLQVAFLVTVQPQTLGINVIMGTVSRQEHDSPLGEY